MAKAVKEKEVTEVVERPYTLRSMKDGDLFPLLSIFRKIGLKDFKDTFSQVAIEKDLKKVGLNVIVNIADVVISNIPQAEEEIYALWSDISGIPAAEIREMEFGTLPLMIVDTFSGVKNTSFFKVLSKLL